ncbi:MAG TPA: hypothetical protein ENJ65_04010 [Candidatus Tenderia electrophaga]|uniref:Uncharacterized protein n=1 Tax=Candidatus Tenderia electrophaga TaxID=1748243 RepID=A0A832N5E4_9GAMM|nr:hypothetical protein [Candidatus Tenderia electrophaga]
MSLLTATPPDAPETLLLLTGEGLLFLAQPAISTTNNRPSHALQYDEDLVAHFLFMMIFMYRHKQQIQAIDSGVPSSEWNGK